MRNVHNNSHEQWKWNNRFLFPGVEKDTATNDAIQLSASSQCHIKGSTLARLTLKARISRTVSTRTPCARNSVLNSWCCALAMSMFTCLHTNEWMTEAHCLSVHAIQRAIGSYWCSSIPTYLIFNKGFEGVV